MFGCLHPTDHNPKRIRKVDKLYADKLDEKIKFPVKIIDIVKIQRKNSIGINVSGCEDKKKTSKNVFNINMLIYYLYVKEKNDYVLIKDFSIFMLGNTLNRGRVLSLSFTRTAVYWNFILEIALKAMVNKGLRCLQRAKRANSKILREL